MGCTGVNLAAKTLLQSVVESEGACEAARDETEGACEAARDETEGACEAARDETETEREVGGVAWEVERDVDRAADVARSLRRYAGGVIFGRFGDCCSTNGRTSISQMHGSV